MVGARDAPLELVARLDDRVDLTPEPSLHVPKRVDDLAQTERADDEEVDVAVRPCLAGCQRAEDKRHVDPLRQRCQRRSEHVDEACRLHDEALQFRVDRTGAVDRVVHVATARRARQDAGVGERLQFPLNGALRGPGAADYLAEVKRLVRPREEETKHPLAGLPQERGAETLRTHNASKCTRYGCI